MELIDIIPIFNLMRNSGRYTPRQIQFRHSILLKMPI